MNLSEAREIINKNRVKGVAVIWCIEDYLNLEGKTVTLYGAMIVKDGVRVLTIPTDNDDIEFLVGVVSKYIAGIKVTQMIKEREER